MFWFGLKKCGALVCFEPSTGDANDANSDTAGEAQEGEIVAPDSPRTFFGGDALALVFTVTSDGRFAAGFLSETADETPDDFLLRLSPDDFEL
jgi:hypothetical protein